MFFEKIFRKYQDCLIFHPPTQPLVARWHRNVSVKNQNAISYRVGTQEKDAQVLLYEDGILAIVIMMIREGRLIDKKDFTYFVDNIDKISFIISSDIILCLLI